MVAIFGAWLMVTTGELGAAQVSRPFVCMCVVCSSVVPMVVVAQCGHCQFDAANVTLTSSTLRWLTPACVHYCTDSALE